MYSATSILAESNLHTRVLQTKLTPKLGPLVPIIRKELEFAMAHELPELNSEYCYGLGKTSVADTVLSGVAECRGVSVAHPTH